MGTAFKSRALLALFLFSYSAFAFENQIRWTKSEDSNGSIEHVIQVISQKAGHPLTAHNFLLQEDRDLAFNHYQRLVQVIDKVPVHGKGIRIWTELGSNQTVQVEADLEFHSGIASIMSSLSSFGKTTHQLQSDLSSEETVSIALDKIATYPDDNSVEGINWKDEWNEGQLIREVKIRGKRGNHFIKIRLAGKKVIAHDYREFPQNDPRESEFQIPVQVYPIYEEVEGKGTLLPRVPAVLTHISKQIPQVSGDIYANLKTQHYYASRLNSDLGETPEGRANGYWSMHYLKEQAQKIRDSLPLVNNEWSKGVLLQGKYATINLHPDAIKQFAPIQFPIQNSSPLFPNWSDSFVQELTLATAYSGKPLFSEMEAWNRVAQRLPDHNPNTYMNDGFDEIQVYYAINTLFDALHARGFKDPEISTRPFNAFLFNPDIAYRDNAFYTDDTINFTTYSPKSPNMARDNSTIWHELGHGIMDRLMGDNLELADTGGLSEGMADFVAAMVIQAVTEGTPFPGSNGFRIINKTGFYLTNEVHDDGEAYGGAMKDFLDSAIQKFGQTGLDKVADLVLEGMRLTRDYPGLTAPEWFKHILFADSLGRPGLREPGELAPLLHAALAGRNFKLDGGPTASFSIVNKSTHEEVTPEGSGSRSFPISVAIQKTEIANFEIEASVKNSEEYSFHFPVQVQVKFAEGPLQGAIHWVGKENGPQVYTLNSESDKVTIPVQVTGTCDEVNRSDGSCVDYAYIQVWNHGELERPVAKKRFYLRIRNRQSIFGKR